MARIGSDVMLSTTWPRNVCALRVTADADIMAAATRRLRFHGLIVSTPFNSSREKGLRSRRRAGVVLRRQSGGGAEKATNL
jgi:hypothetical protein